MFFAIAEITINPSWILVSVIIPTAVLIYSVIISRYILNWNFQNVAQIPLYQLYQIGANTCKYHIFQKEYL